MSSIAAAAISSSFSPSINTLKCTKNNRLLLQHNPLLPSSDSSLRAQPSARLSLSSPGGPDPFPIAAATWRPPKVFTPAVAQDEAATETVTETEAAAETETETEIAAAAETETEAVAETAAETETAAVAETEAVAETAAATPAEGEQNAQGEAAVNTKLYFGNLPYNIDSAQLAGIIQDYGSPELIEVLYDKVTGRSRGFAFVTMSSVEDCTSVIQNLDGKPFFGRMLRVNFSDKPRTRDPLYPETEFKLFVGNLSWSVTSDMLTEAFQPFGTVVGARVLYDGETGRSRGYGFVCYSTKSEMDAALEAANGLELGGRAIRVFVAQGKK